MPSSFLVRAKDRAGNSVMMVINPNSVTTVYRLGELSIYARHFADIDIEGRRPILVKPNGS